MTDSRDTPPLHKLLIRQIRRHLGTIEDLPPAMTPFLEAVSSSYEQFDSDHALLEHTLEESTQELLEQIQMRQELADRQRRDEELQQAAEIQRRLDAEMLHMQADMIEQLSLPVIPISRHILVMPLIGTIDTRRARKIGEVLLSSLAGNQARVAILDITGVPVVDHEVAEGLVNAARAAQLLGAQVVLTGIRPEVAQTLVGIGVDLSGITTHGTLQSGIAAMSR
jgi:rsbT co-antagonist protein RsbR